MKIAITGNIGCGKTTFTKMLLSKLEGFQHFCIDTAVRELYTAPEHKDFRRDLVKKFGTDDRKQISDLVFADPNKRLWLEDLSARLLKHKLQMALYQRDVIVEFPLLFEMGSSKDYDYVVTCYTDDATQEQRVMARDGFTQEKIARIRESQLSTEVKKALADDMVDTTVSLDELDEKAEAVAKVIRYRSIKLHYLLAYYSEQDKAGAAIVYDNVIAEYSKKGRHHHGVPHIHGMYQLYIEYGDKLNYPGLVANAILFHDVVYNVGANYGNNEWDSARFMMKQFKEHLPSILSAEVDKGVPSIPIIAEYVMSTKGHEITSPILLANPRLKADCEMFLDFDLWVLGQDPGTALRFDDNIHREFYHAYEPLVFAQGRIQVLQSFLARPQIFMSPSFQHLNVQARENLEMLIDKWQKVLVQ